MSQVTRIRNGIFSSNTYFYQIPNTNDCFVIDAGLDFQAIDTHLTEHKLNPVAVLCTHGHFDHLGSAQPVKEKYGAKIYLHKNDLKVSKAANFLLMACKIDHRISTPLVDFFIEGECETVIAGITVRWIQVPGHTPGSCFIQIADSIFTGDTLYKQAVGLSDFPGEDKDQLIKSILRIWDMVEDHLTVYPGHGGSDTFINIKNNNNPLRSLLGFNPAQDSIFRGSIHEE